ncbi:MAG: response regulator [Fibrobacter sp.]|nr:response regulator [Fibrobacter sp.]
MIYIVEDDSEIREMEAYALKSSGFNVYAFDCGKALDEAIKACVPDLIIHDIMLPGEDGLSILRRLRAQENTRNVPVIMLTAKGSEIDKVKGLMSTAELSLFEARLSPESKTKLQCMLKELNVNDLNAQRYSYQMGVHYMDLINDCEKLGDYVVNVVEAHNNKKFA